MKIWKTAALCAVMITAFTFTATAAAPVFEPRTPAQDSMGPGGSENGGGSFGDNAESMIDGVLPGDNAETGTADATLGDTNGDGAVESDNSTGAAESMLGGMTDTAGDSESNTGADSGSATDTAQSSSGASEEDGMGMGGILLTVAVIGAGAALLFALWPKKRA